MADVLIVCVREDEPQAKALAEMFEAAGFSIGGAPSSDAALRSSGAGVVVWSQASIRSRPFLDAAQRVINAGKAVVASLIEPPPPASIGDAPAFDLSVWEGDPNDSALDPLFFAVDRMVNSQRASVGTAQTEVDDPPPLPRSMRRDPPPAPPPPQSPVQRAASMFSTPPADPLRSETEHWRAIRDSRNPADFMDYLARYGPNGAFAEVAELRLKQLTERAPAPPPPPPRPRIEARRDPPPPVRPPPPPPRREPPPAMVRRDPPPPPPPPRVNFDRPPPTYDRGDLRDVPKQEGGALRALVLIALLGGLALAGGLYFGGNLGSLSGSDGKQAPASQQQAATDEPATLDPSAVPPAEPVGSPITAASQPTTAAQRRAQQQQTQQRNTNTDSSGRDLNAAATPQQYAANNPPPSPATGGGGPISLTSTQPGTTAASNSNSGAAPINPGILPQSAPQTPTPVSSAATRPPPSVRFTARPTARRIADLYPDRAIRDSIGGRVELDCAVTSSLGLQCGVASETPPGVGFARAALSAAQSYRVAPTLTDGSSAVGTRTRVAVQFQAPN
jgi:hypothetical protein